MKKSQLKSYIKEQIIETLSNEVNEDTFVGKEAKKPITRDPKFSKLAPETKTDTLKKLDKGESVTLEEGDSDVIKSLLLWLKSFPQEKYSISPRTIIEKIEELQKLDYRKQNKDDWDDGEEIKENNNYNESFNIGDKVSFEGIDGETATGIIISAKFKVKVDNGGPERYFDSDEPEDVKKINENLDEMARRAVLVMLGDKKKAEKVKKNYEGKWMAKMIDNVIAAGKEGISQPALAASIDKQQQAINTPVKQLIDAGVFKIVGDAPKKAEKEEPTKTEKPKSNPKNDDLEDEPEIKDDWNTKDDEDSKVGDEEQELDKQATAGAAKISGKAAKLDKAIRDLKNVEAEMKTLANQYKTAEGEAKEKIVADLKSKTQIKKELEKLRDQYANQIV